METKMNLVFLTFVYFMSLSAGIIPYPYMCNIINLDDEYKHINISNPVDRQILIGILDDRDCSMSIQDIKENYILSGEVKKLLARKNNRVMINLKLSCEHRIMVTFLDFKTPTTLELQNLDFVLEFEKCSTLIEQIDYFLEIGRVIMLIDAFSEIKTKQNTNCRFASDLQVLQYNIHCSGKNYFTTTSFWDSCTQAFPNLLLLSMTGCTDGSIIIAPENLREKFPNLESLVLQSVVVNGSLLFPWKTSPLSHNKQTEDIFKAFFSTYTDIYFYNMFPDNSLILTDCLIALSSLHFSKEINLLALTEMAVSDLQPQFLQNTTLTHTLNLSKNKLKTIHPGLLQNQYQLQYLFLQDNRLTEISQNMFANLKLLCYINLSQNNIAVIEPNTFKGLYHLKDINLHNNSIQQIPQNMFKDQANALEYLELKYNPINNIPTWPLYSPSLRTLDLRHSNITGNSIVALLHTADKLDIAEKLVQDQMTLESIPESTATVIDLSFNKITTIPSAGITGKMMIKLKYLFQNFVIGFQGNPFTCNCDISVIQEIVSSKDALELMMQSLIDWVCVKPPEFQGRLVWTITDNEKYCPINVRHCPVLCSCYKRKMSDVVIIDCRGTVLMEMPENLPPFKLELWLQNSNISEISSLPYLKNITVLNLAGNQLKAVLPSIINKLKILEFFHLESNHLTALPIQVKSMNLKAMTISNNHFICDCFTRWMKNWLLSEENLVSDWADVKCLDQSNTLQQLIAVPDSQFTCKGDNSFSVTQHVFLPSIIIGSILFVLVVVALMIYIQRFDIKVLLFIHFNFHPFDKQSPGQETYTYDAIIIYTVNDLDLKNSVEKHLNEKGYHIADFYKNSFIGYSYTENIEKLVNLSYKVILLTAENSFNDKIIQAAWSIAYNKALSSTMSRIILVTDKLLKKQPDYNESVKQFLKSNNFIDRNSKFLKEKVEYLMPEVKPAEAFAMEMEEHEMIIPAGNDTCRETYQILISYPDEHHLFIMNEIVPYLSANSVDVKILDMQFTPGADIRDELPTILDAFKHLMFIFSEDSLGDDISGYILSQAVTKAQLENQNFLLLCTSGKIHLEDIANDVTKYIENYVTVSLKDPLLKERILESIRCNDRVQKEDMNDTENVPLI